MWLWRMGENGESTGKMQLPHCLQCFLAQAGSIDECTFANCTTRTRPFIRWVSRVPTHVHQGSYAHAVGFEDCWWMQGKWPWYNNMSFFPHMAYFLIIMLLQLEVLNSVFQRILGPTQYPHLEPCVPSWDVVAGRGWLYNWSHVCHRLSRHYYPSMLSDPRTASQWYFKQISEINLWPLQ